MQVGQDGLDEFDLRAPGMSGDGSVSLCQVIQINYCRIVSEKMDGVWLVGLNLGQIAETVTNAQNSARNELLRGDEEADAKVRVGVENAAALPNRSPVAEPSK